MGACGQAVLAHSFLLKQSQYAPVAVAAQIITLLALSEKLFDSIPIGIFNRSW